MENLPYYKKDDDYLTADNLRQDDQFLDDAVAFLTKRAGLKPEEAADNNLIFDEFMEHFRSQNVNEVTAVRDYYYATEADEEDRARMGRLMETFDRMGSNLDWTAVGDYAEGLATAPSTWAGLLSFGAGKAGAVAANQGVKFGLKQALKQGGLRTALGSMAVEGTAAGATTLAQEGTRVETGQKEEVDMGNVGISTGVGTVAGGVLGLFGGTQAARTTFKGQTMANEMVSRLRKPAEEAYETVTKPLLDGTAKGSKKIKPKVEKLKKQLRLEETIPQLLGEGKILRGETPASTVEFNQKVIDNTVTAVARVIDKIPEAKVTELGEERITSRIARGFAEGKIQPDEFDGILKAHGVTGEQFGAILAADVSEAGATLGKMSALKRKALTSDTIKNLSKIDANLSRSYEAMTERAKRAAEEDLKKGALSSASKLLDDANRLRIGIMTTQLATTVRNTTNGFMRNYIYAMDNLSTGAARYIDAKKTLKFSADEHAITTAKDAVNIAKAELRTGLRSILPTDFFMGSPDFGMTGTAEAYALKQAMTDPMLGFSDAGRRMFRELGDIGIQGSQEVGPLTKIAAKANVLNTMSDNMFKRAIFAREMDKILRTNGVEGGLKEYMRVGDFSGIEKGMVRDAIENTLEFTYQSDFRGQRSNADGFARWFIDFFSKPLPSVIIPFPRYIMNQFKFMYEHTPVLGALDIFNRMDTPQKMGKQITGLTMIGAFYSLKSQFADETTGPMELKDPKDGSIIDMEAMLGPYSGHFLMADKLFRDKDFFINTLKMPESLWHGNDRVASVQGPQSRDFFKALTGGDYRSNQIFSAFDDIMGTAMTGSDSVKSSEDLDTFMRDTLGDLVSSFTVPMGMVRDVVATVDPDYRTVPNSEDVNLFEHLLKNAVKSFPRYYDAEQGLITDEWLGDEFTTDPLYLPTRDEPAKAALPFMKQLTGLTYRARRNPVEAEFERLGIEWRQYAPPRIRSNPELENKSRQFMGQLVDQFMNNFVMADERYQDMSAPEQVHHLKKMLGDFKTIAMGKTLDIDALPSDADDALIEERAKAQVLRKDSDRRKLMMEMFKQEYGYEFDPDNDRYIVLLAQENKID